MSVTQCLSFDMVIMFFFVYIYLGHRSMLPNVPNYSMSIYFCSSFFFFFFFFLSFFLSCSFLFFFFSSFYSVRSTIRITVERAIQQTYIFIMADLLLLPLFLFVRLPVVASSSFSSQTILSTTCVTYENKHIRTYDDRTIIN